MGDAAFWDFIYVVVAIVGAISVALCVVVFCLVAVRAWRNNTREPYEYFSKHFWRGLAVTLIVCAGMMLTFALLVGA